jgi:thymidylate synthase (FAD)
MKLEAKLVAYTQPVESLRLTGPEDFIAFAARVSSNLDYSERGQNYEKLLKYCIDNKHWSVFEMADAIVEVQAPRDITRQLLRHRSFSFQEFSQRYSDQIVFTNRDFRRQDTRNRQNSTDDLDPDVKSTAQSFVRVLVSKANEFYHSLRSQDVAKECARVFLPEGLTMSTLYVKGSLRSWIHYLEVRDDPGVTQWEHVLMARKIKEALLPVFPKVLGMLND